MKTKMTAKFHSLKISLLMTGVLLALRLASAQCDPPPSGLVGWWPGEGNFNDIIGTNNGTSGGVVTFTPGEVGSAFSLDNGYVYIPIVDTNSDLNLINAVTFEAWVNHDQTSQIYQRYITIASNSTEKAVIRYDGRSPASFHFYIRVGGVLHELRSAVALQTGIFYHIIGTYDGTVQKLYVNGSLANSQLVTGPLFQSATGIIIGGSGAEGMKGLIDEASVYNRALSAGEVAAIYAAGSAGKCKTPIITSQPQSQLGYWGQNASFSVGASPLPLNYQWQSNGVAITGATNQTLTLTNLQNSFAAGYTVVVSNPYGSVTSAPPANLTINPAGVAIALYPGVKIDGVVGLTYGIQSSSNLANTNGWIGVTNLTFTQPTEIWYDAIPASLAQRFYRVLQGPIPIP